MQLSKSGVGEEDFPYFLGFLILLPAPFSFLSSKRKEIPVLPESLFRYFCFL